MKKILESEIPSFFTLLKIAFSPLSKKKKFFDDYCKKNTKWIPIRGSYGMRIMTKEDYEKRRKRILEYNFEL